MKRRQNRIVQRVSSFKATRNLSEREPLSLLVIWCVLLSLCLYYALFRQSLKWTKHLWSAFPKSYVQQNWLVIFEIYSVVVCSLSFRSEKVELWFFLDVYLMRNGEEKVKYPTNIQYKINFNCCGFCILLIFLHKRIVCDYTAFCCRQTFGHFKRTFPSLRWRHLFFTQSQEFYCLVGLSGQ